MERIGSATGGRVSPPAGLRFAGQESFAVIEVLSVNPLPLSSGLRFHAPLPHAIRFTSRTSCESTTAPDPAPVQLVADGFAFSY
jgi:hypothetical protein